MIKLTKSTLEGHILATPSSGDPVEVTRDIVVNQLIKYGCTLIEANKHIGDLLDGLIKEVRVGKE
jgi:hypothetical protein